MNKRTISILGLLALLAAGLYLVPALLGERSRAGVGEVRGASSEAGAGRPGAELSAPAGTAVEQPAASGRERTGPARVRVVALSEAQGEVVPGALLSLSRVGLEEDPSAGPTGEWISLEPGPWAAEVVAPGYTSSELEFTLEMGEELELSALLGVGTRVLGTVEDRMGAPVRGNWIFLLEAGQSHPVLPQQAEGMIGVRPDREGRFETERVPPGEYLLSYGPIGRAIHTSDWKLQLRTGVEPEVLVLLKGEARLDVIVTPAPPADRDFMFELQEFDDERAERRRERGRTLSPADEEREKERSWRRKTGQHMRVNGTVTLTRLSPGTYRACLKTHPGSFTSVETFEILPELSYELRIQQPALPTRGLDRGAGGPEPLRRDELVIELRELQGSADGRPAGIYRL